MARQGEATVTLSLIDRVTGPIKRISARLAALGNRIGLDRIGVAVNRVGTAFRSLGEGLLSSATRLTSVVTVFGAAAAGVVAASYNLAKSTADLAAEVNDTAFKLGIGVEALQEFRYAAGLSSIEAKTFDKGVEKLGINAVAATKGNKELAKAFKSLGVNVKGTKGQMRPTEAILNDTLVALTKIEDPIKRNALAFKLFGKSGVELTKMLGDGAEGLAAARKEARELGFVFDESAAKLGDEFGDNVDRLKLRLEGFRRFLGVQLLPVMNEMVLAVSAWLKENAALIRSTITTWVKRLATFLRDLMNPTSELRQQISRLGESLSNAGKAIASFYQSIKPAIDFVGGPAVAAFGLLAAWIFGPVIAALGALAAAFINLGVVILSTPVGWFLAAVAAMGAAAYVLYQRWDDFVAYWSGLWGRITSAFKENWFKGIVTALQEFNPVTHITRGMNELFEYFTGIDLMAEGDKLMAKLADGIRAGAAKLGGLVSQGMDWFQQFTTDMGMKAFNAGVAFVQSIWDGIKSKWQEVVAWLHGAVNDLIGFLPDSIKSQLGFDVNANVKTGDSGLIPKVPAVKPVVPGAIPDVIPSAARSSASSLFSPTNDNAQPSANDNANPSSITTGNINASSVIMPEPIVAHEPQTVNAPFNVNLTINAPGADANAIAGAVKSALAAQQSKQAAAVKSSLSD